MLRLMQQPIHPFFSQRVISVIIRNGISVIGVLWLGWSAERMVLLYFVDTMAGIWAVLTAIVYLLSNGASANWGDKLYNGGNAALGALFIVALVGVPLGLPLLFMVQWNWQSLWQLLETSSFLNAALGIGITNLVLSIRLYFKEINSKAIYTFQSPINRHFAILLTRWAFLVFSIYAASTFLGNATKYVCVVIYAVSTIYSELFPSQFANLLPAKQAQVRRPRHSRR